MEIWFKLSSALGDGGGDPIALWLDIGYIRPKHGGNKVWAAGVYSRAGGTGDLYAASCTNTIPSLHTWHHLAVTVAGRSSYPLVYHNGVLQTCTTSITSFGGTYYADLIGAHSFNSGSTSTTAAITSSTSTQYRFQGDIGEVRIWSVARTVAQISANMNTRLSGSETGLRALYTFQSDTGVASSTCRDETGSYSGQYIGSCSIVNRSPT